MAQIHEEAGHAATAGRAAAARGHGSEPLGRGVARPGAAPVVDLLPPRHRRLPERLRETIGWEARFGLPDADLADILREAGHRTQVVSWAVRRIEDAAAC